MTEETRPVIGTKHPDAISTKVIEVNGELHLVNVMPPGPEEHDDRTWHIPNPTIDSNYPSFIYNGPSLLSEDDEPVDNPRRDARYLSKRRASRKGK